MKIINRFCYIATSIAATAGSVAVSLFGWEPSMRTIALAAFIALLFAANARNTQASAHTQ